MAQHRAQWDREMKSLRIKPEIVTAKPEDETLSYMEEDTKDESETLRGEDDSYLRRSSDMMIVDSEVDEMSDYL